MKKIICLVVVVLMIAAVAYAAKKVAITKTNVASLKGTWVGVLDLGRKGETTPITLEVLNDAPPLKAKWTLANVPEVVAKEFGEMGGQKVGEADDGMITSAGTVMWIGPQKNFIELTLMDDKKLGCWAFWRGMDMRGTLAKKK
jgi:hypothetical protein